MKTVLNVRLKTFKLSLKWILFYPDTSKSNDVTKWCMVWVPFLFSENWHKMCEARTGFPLVQQIGSTIMITG